MGDCFELRSTNIFIVFYLQNFFLYYFNAKPCAPIYQCQKQAEISIPEQADATPPIPKIYLPKKQPKFAPCQNL
jgi:hypothetical protein